MFGKVCILVVALAVSTFSALPQTKYPKEILDCYTQNKGDGLKFNACLLQFWERNRMEIVKGVPSLNIPVLEPMVLDNINFVEKGSVVDVTATFTQVLVRGVANHVAKAVEVDPKTKTLIIKLSFPLLHITGQYDIKGSLLVLPVEGKGPFTLNLTNVDGIGTSHFTSKGGKVEISKLDIDFTIGGVKVDFTGLLGGDEVATAVVNMFQDNQAQILADIKPAVSRQMSETIMKSLQSGLFDLPAEAVGL